MSVPKKNRERWRAGLDDIPGIDKWFSRKTRWRKTIENRFLPRNGLKIICSKKQSTEMSLSSPENLKYKFIS